MIEISDNCAIDIVIKDIMIFKNNFLKLLIQQRADNILPIFELTLSMPTTELLTALRKANTEIELNYGQTTESIVKRKFLVKNYSMQPSGDNFRFKITGILSIKDYTNKLNIIAIKDTSDKVLSSEIAGVDLDITYSGIDKQVWIRHNIPEKEFVDRVLDYAYISDKDLVLAGLNVDKKLRIYSVKDTFAGKEKFTFMNDVEGGSSTDVRFQSMSFETDDSIFRHLLAEGTKQPVYRLKEGKIDYIDSNGKSMKNSESFDEITESRNAPLLIDNGNCHSGYYSAYACNLSNKVNLFSNSIILIAGQKFFKEDELTLLDLVKLMPNSSSGEVDEFLKGKYLITGKDIVVNQKGFQQSFRLNRDYML